MMSLYWSIGTSGWGSDQWSVISGQLSVISGGAGVTVQVCGVIGRSRVFFRRRLSGVCAGRRGHVRRGSLSFFHHE